MLRHVKLHLQACSTSPEGLLSLVVLPQLALLLIAELAGAASSKVNSSSSSPILEAVAGT